MFKSNQSKLIKTVYFISKKSLIGNNLKDIKLAINYNGWIIYIFIIYLFIFYQNRHIRLVELVFAQKKKSCLHTNII